MSHLEKLIALGKPAVIIGGISLGVFSILEYFAAPYAWLCGSIFLMCLYLSLRSLHSWGKAVWLNIGLAILTLGSFELYVWLQDGKTQLWYDPEYHTGHPLLGYVAQRNHVGSSTRHDNGKLTFDVQYTIGANGLRVSPPSTQENSDCILFFGGSFTFGEGVPDEQTMPYQVGLKTHQRYQIHNFGFHGYGPHHMLAALEHQIVEEAIQCAPRYVIYQAIVAHAARVAGRAFWDRHGPRYVLEEGRVVFRGRFSDTSLFSDAVYDQFRKSAIVQRVMRKKGAQVEPQDIQLFGESVAAARDYVEKHYPDSVFHVLFWDWFGEERRIAMLEALRQRDIVVHPISTILPDRGENGLRYQLSPSDIHPSPLAHERIAEYVVYHIIADTE